MPKAPTTESGHFHAVRFYQDAASLADLVCAFVGDGLKEGEPAVLIATAEHTEFFRKCFTARGVDVGAVIASGSLTLLDADHTLSMFMRDGVPMAKAFVDAISPTLRFAASRHPGRAIRAYGEMVDVLWRKGQTAAAIRLETLWNDLGRSHEFKLLCGYAMGNFYKGSATEEICSVHTHVVTDSGTHVRVS